MGSKKHPGKKNTRETNVEASSIQDNSMDDADNEHSLKAGTIELPLTNECHHYTSIEEVPWDIQK
jgi:hypothetical protein